MEKIKVYNKTVQRVLYAEAAFEYFVNILVTGGFLTNILNQAGIPDAFSGILSSFALFTCVAQTVSITLNRAGDNFKKIVSMFCVLDELVFALLYIIPFFNIPSVAKTIILSSMLLIGLLLLNYTKSSKLNWMISMVPANERGVFNAKKEMISLITGMILTISMGALIDYFKSINNIKAGFYICSLSIILFSSMHLITILMCKKPDLDEIPNIKLWDSVKEVFNNKVFQKLIVIDILWNVSMSLNSFNGVYQLNTLKFSMILVSVIAVIGSFARLIVSMPFGKLADKTSWPYMMRISFIIAFASYVVYAFTTPFNGKIMFTLHMALFSISVAGSNGGLINIAFEYIPEKMRTTAIGIKFAVGGISGFLASLVYGVVVSGIQSLNNKIFGITVYPQQLIAAFSAVVTLALVIYIYKVIEKLKRI